MKKTICKHEAPTLGESTNSIHINVDEIPDYVRDELAVATLKFIDNILNQQGGREMPDAKDEERKKRQSDKDTSAEQGSDCGTDL